MPRIGIAIVAYLLAFALTRHAFPGGIVFYQGVGVALIMSGCLLAVELRREAALGAALKDALLAFLLMYAFVFTIPTTVDRAYSVKLITELAKSDGGLTSDQIQQWFSDDFLKGAAVQKRIREQTATGSIEVAGDRYRLTELGRVMAAAFKATAAAFALEERDP